MGHSKSMRMAEFDRSDMTSYRSVIVNTGYLVPFLSYLTLKNIVTLKCRLVITQCHIRVPIRRLL